MTLSAGYLLDTNVVSELKNTHPRQAVSDWIAARQIAALYLSVITVGEVRFGAANLTPGRRRAEIERWIEARLLPQFTGRILPITQDVADRWGRISAECRRTGVTLGAADGLIAATALERNLVLVTRNTSHFAHSGLTVVNPWVGAP